LKKTIIRKDKKMAKRKTLVGIIRIVKKNMK